jgi:hypothetical protein
MRHVEPVQVTADVEGLTLGRRPLDTTAYPVRSGTSWVLVDTGWPGNGPAIRVRPRACSGTAPRRPRSC